MYEERDWERLSWVSELLPASDKNMVKNITLDVVQWLAHRTPGSNCPKGQEIYPADSITHPSNNQNQLKSSVKDLACS